MHDEEVLDLIREHVHGGKLLFSVCTGALLCGAAGVLVGRQVTTHWSARHLMRYYGAVLVDARVAVDGDIIMFQKKYEPIGRAREAEAILYAERNEYL